MHADFFLLCLLPIFCSYLPYFFGESWRSGYLKGLLTLIYRPNFFFGVFDRATLSHPRSEKVEGGWDKAFEKFVSMRWISDGGMFSVINALDMRAVLRTMEWFRGPLSPLFRFLRPGQNSIVASKHSFLPAIKS